MEWPWGGKHLDFWQGVALERLGWEKALEQLHGELVQQDDYGPLWRIQPSRPRTPWGMASIPEPIVLVDVIKTTQDPGGSRRRYYLPVPASTRTGRQVVAWTFGIRRVRDDLVAAESPRQVSTITGRSWIAASRLRALVICSEV